MLDLGQSRGSAAQGKNEGRVVGYQWVVVVLDGIRWCDTLDVGGTKQVYSREYEMQRILHGTLLCCTLVGVVQELVNRWCLRCGTKPG